MVGGRAELAEGVGAQRKRDLMRGHRRGVGRAQVDQSGQGGGAEGSRLRAFENLELVEVEEQTGTALALLNTLPDKLCPGFLKKFAIENAVKRFPALNTSVKSDVRTKKSDRRYLTNGLQGRCFSKAGKGCLSVLTAA